jgi:hypothetical protein
MLQIENLEPYLQAGYMILYGGAVVEHIVAVAEFSPYPLNKNRG